MPVTNGSTITGTAILGYRGLILISSMKMFLKHGMRMTRIATPANMRAIATEFTGKPYARSRKGLEQAYADMVALRDAKPDLDALGDTVIVNQEIERSKGGAA